MYSFGNKSEEKLNGVNPDIVRVARRALSFGVMDFSVIEGLRTAERQQDLYREGKSQLDGVTVRSKHQGGNAIDILPYPAVVNSVNVWDDKQRFCVLAGLMYAAASLEGVSIRWGGDWDGDGNNADSSFFDAPHFELVT